MFSCDHELQSLFGQMFRVLWRENEILSHFQVFVDIFTSPEISVESVFSVKNRVFSPNQPYIISYWSERSASSGCVCGECVCVCLIFATGLLTETEKSSNLHTNDFE